MRQLACVFTLIMATGACASAPAQPVIKEAPQTPPAILSSGADNGTGTEVRLSSDIRSIEGEILAPRDSVWSALPAMWQALGIPVASIDRARGTLRSGRFRAPHSLGGKSLRELVDCGYSVTGPRADIWEVSMEIMTVVQPANSARTRIATQIISDARPRDGTSTQGVSCGSLGELERTLAQRLQQRFPS